MAKLTRGEVHKAGISHNTNKLADTIRQFLVFTNFKPLNN